MLALSRAADPPASRPDKVRLLMAENALRKQAQAPGRPGGPPLGCGTPHRPLHIRTPLSHCSSSHTALRRRDRAARRHAARGHEQGDAYMARFQAAYEELAGPVKPCPRPSSAAPRPSIPEQDETCPISMG
jgi:hypothetical protein